MSTFNQKLSELYRGVLGETEIMAPFGENGLSMPFLIKFADDRADETADDLRVMFFGQESLDWARVKSSITEVMDNYSKFFNDFNEYP